MKYQVVIEKLESLKKNCTVKWKKVVLLDELPDEWTYPLIQPLLIAEYERRK